MDGQPDFAALDDGELGDLVASLEDMRAERCRADVCFFAENIEIPGTPPPLTEKQREKLRGTARRKDILDPTFADDDDTEFYPRTVELADHHRLILESVVGMMEGQPLTGEVDGETITAAPDGLMLFMPPGSAKSSFGTVLAPAYVMGRFPGTDVISASYGAMLSHRFARRVRHIVRDPAYHSVFKTTLVADNQAVDQWSMENGSAYRSTGILGAVTGFRADILFLDDVIAGMEEADSDIIREKTSQAIMGDLFTRLKPGGKIMLTMTRWHEDDPAGRLLGEKWKGQSGLWRGTDGRLWCVINIPMLAEHDDDPLGRKPGEMLWPQWFKRTEVERLKNGNARVWSALYQQRPTAAAGAIITRDLWRCWPHGNSEPTPDQIVNPHKTHLPKDIWHFFMCYDTAFEEEEKNDPSAMTLWGLFEHKTHTPDARQIEQVNMILIDAWNERVDSIELFSRIEAHVKQFRPHQIVIEKRASGIQLIQELTARRWPVYSFLPRGRPGAKGKVPRARMAAYLMDSGTVWYMPNKRTREAIDQAAAFPFGKNNDLVDTITSAIEVSRRTDFEVASDILDTEEQAEKDHDDATERSRERRGYGRL
jgi:phage terminase large subunit-like protein